MDDYKKTTLRVITLFRCFQCFRLPDERSSTVLVGDCLPGGAF